MKLILAINLHCSNAQPCCLTGHNPPLGEEPDKNRETGGGGFAGGSSALRCAPSFDFSAPRIRNKEAEGDAHTMRRIP